MICAMTMICFWASSCWSCDPSEKSWNQLEFSELSQDPSSIQISFKLANETQSRLEQHYIHASLHGGVTLTRSLESNANECWKDHSNAWNFQDQGQTLTALWNEDTLVRH